MISIITIILIVHHHQYRHLLTLNHQHPQRVSKNVQKKTIQPPNSMYVLQIFAFEKRHVWKEFPREAGHSTGGDGSQGRCKEDG